MAEQDMLQVVVGAPHVSERVSGHVVFMLRHWGGQGSGKHATEEDTEI